MNKISILFRVGILLTLFPSFVFSHHLKVLVVDDAPIFRHLIIEDIKRALQGGVDIVETDTEENALRLLKEEQFDLVITDIEIGKESNEGWNIVREAESLGTREVIVVSNTDKAEEIDKIISYHVQYFGKLEDDRIVRAVASDAVKLGFSPQDRADPISVTTVTSHHELPNEKIRILVFNENKEGLRRALHAVSDVVGESAEIIETRSFAEANEALAAQDKSPFDILIMDVSGKSVLSLNWPSSLEDIESSLIPVEINEAKALVPESIISLLQRGRVGRQSFSLEKAAKERGSTRVIKTVNVKLPLQSAPKPMGNATIRVDSSLLEIIFSQEITNAVTAIMAARKHSPASCGDLFQ